MAGDWIKFDISTFEKPEVISMADELSMPETFVVGCLLLVWSWFDLHTENGNAAGVTLAFINRRTGVKGFAEAMVRVGWLVDEEGVLTIPSFDRHNGKSAKKRALTAQRVANHKANAMVTPSALPREEKSIKKINKRKSTNKTPMTDEFTISDRVRKWAEEKGHNNLENHLDNFKIQCRAKNYKYADWDSAFMGAIRSDWAKLSEHKTPGPPRRMLTND